MAGEGLAGFGVLICSQPPEGERLARGDSITGWLRLPGALLWMSFCGVWIFSVLLFPWLKGQPLGYVPVVLGACCGGVLLRRTVCRVCNRWIGRPMLWRYLIFLAALTAFLRLAVLVIMPVQLTSDSAAYHDLARQILASGEYGQTAHLPPGFPYVLAGWYRLTTAHAFSGYVLGVLLSTAAVLLVYDVARRVAGEQAGRWAALLASLMPTLVFTAPRVHTTPILTVLVCAFADLGAVSIGSGRRKVIAVAGLGLLAGAGALVRPTLLLLPGIMLVCWLLAGFGWRSVVWFVVTVVLMAAVVAPWTARNFRVLGAFVPVSTNGGYCLYNGLNPESDGLWSRREPLPGETDEVARDRLRRRAALRWLGSHPVDGLTLIARKQAYMWGVSSTNIATAISPRVPRAVHETLRMAIKAVINTAWVALLVLCVVASVRTHPWQNRRLLPALGFVLSLLAIHLLFEVQARYNVPAIPVLVVVASTLLASDQNPSPADAGQDSVGTAAN